MAKSCKQENRRIWMFISPAGEKGLVMQKGELIVTAKSGTIQAMMDVNIDGLEKYRDRLETMPASLESEKTLIGGDDND